MHIDAKFGTKIRPVGVEILKPSRALTLQIDKAKQIPLHNNFNKSRELY